MASHPYEDLPAQAFWSRGVAQADPLAPDAIYQRKWALDPDWKIATAGSCFAQHVARYMRERSFNVIDTEPAPGGLADERRKAYGYELYSARYGNIYTTRQLLQLLREAHGQHTPEAAIWAKNGRYFDALRPGVEPEGLESEAEVRAHRAHHLACVREMVAQMDMFVFTLGLTEAWEHTASGTVFPAAPGTLAGTFDAAQFRFVNFSHSEVMADLVEALALIDALRSKETPVLLTVSPVPLTATAGGRHILLSSTYSKAVLRAVAGELADRNDMIDYFPSYEIITNPAAKSRFYAENLRSVLPEGVATAMAAFFGEQVSGSTVAQKEAEAEPEDEDELHCEEAMLEAFAK